MSPLLKTDEGWKIDKSSMLTWLISILLGAIIAAPSTYYSIKFMVSDHDKRITSIEADNKAQSYRITAVETYVTQDIVNTQWLKSDINEMKVLLNEIRKDQKRGNK
jgi:hypothetical protein